MQPCDFRPSAARLAAFRTAVWDHYRREGRDLPWRRTKDPYEILVSEVMLQQTQVARVLAKFPEFLTVFPSLEGLAAASTVEVLAAWSGLGYNRRALALQRGAKMMIEHCGGQVPASLDALRALPGIGPATASAVCVFAFGQPHAFCETNIRSAFIHFFFPGSTAVADAEILPLVETTIDRSDPRRWFYALMDYGVWTKRAFGNPGRMSRHHAVQAPFSGSRRELRGQALRALLSAAPAAAEAAAVSVMLSGPPRDPAEVLSVLDDLAGEGFLTKENGGYRIA